MVCFCCCTTLQGDLWYFIDDGPLFDSLPSVVDHYMLFPDGLPTLLRYPVSPMGTKMPANPNKPVSTAFAAVTCGSISIQYSMLLEGGGFSLHTGEEAR